MSRVVVVGAGPTGLMLACELRAAGVDTILLERLAEPTGQSRALALHARTVELLEQRGLLEPFLAVGVQWPQIHFAGLPLDMTKLRGQHQYSLHLHQSLVEQLLEQAAGKAGTDIRRGHELVGFIQDDAEVRATVRGPEGEYTLSCGYLVGCDGGGSAVRKLAGIDFPGEVSRLSGILGDVTSFSGEVRVREPLNYPHGMLGVSPLGDGLFRIMCVEWDGDVVHDGPATEDELRATVRRITASDSMSFGRPTWLSRFGDATRQATRYRHGRVFLAGDAAHIHFPLGAQGMNLGMQDAANLGWKLAAAMHGWAPEGLLDTYHDERHPVGRRVCDNSRAQLAMTYPVDRTTPLRDLFGTLTGFDEVHRYLVEMMAGTDVRYPMRSAHPADGMLGTRVPDVPLVTAEGETSVLRLLRDARGLLLDLSGEVTTPALADGRQDRLSVIHARPSASLPYQWMLIRPDGHLAWAGGPGDGDTLGEALTTWFGAA
jgi:2-polyprenyl-6-methoxyphenol hydroxylase-like FAD-dependent oxidoreductase